MTVIEAIKAGEDFYIEKAFGDRVYLVVAFNAAGYEWVKSEADALQPNDLLSLPECR